MVTNVRVFLSVDFSAGFRNVSWGIDFVFFYSIFNCFFLGSLDDVICP